MIVQEKLTLFFLYSHIHNSSDTRYEGGVSHSNASSECPKTQLTTDTSQSWCRPHRLRAHPHSSVASVECKSQVVRPQVTHNFCQHGYKSKVPRTFSLGSAIC